MRFDAKIHGFDIPEEPTGFMTQEEIVRHFDHLVDLTNGESATTWGEGTDSPVPET